MTRVRRLYSLLALAAFALVLVGCGQSATTSTTSTAAQHLGPTTPVQTGYGGQEYFCAQQPLRGEIHYDGVSGNVSMNVTVDGLPPNTFVSVNWLNNTVRGYVIGSFATGHAGGSIPTSLRLFRPGETRGYQILLTTAATIPVNLGVLWPCGLPPHVPALTADNPKVVVTPSKGLSDGQVVKVAVTGFGVSGKVWLSECDHAEDANYLGCGPQLAAQPFIITDDTRSGSTDFTIHSSAPSKPYNLNAQEPCTRLCVVVAVAGGGVWAVAPITFGSSQPVSP